MKLPATNSLSSLAWPHSWEKTNLHQSANLQISPASLSHILKSVYKTKVYKHPEDTTHIHTHYSTSFHYVCQLGDRGWGWAPSDRESGRSVQVAGCGARLWFAEGACQAPAAGLCPLWPETVRSSRGRGSWTCKHRVSRPPLWLCKGELPEFWPCSLRPPPAGLHGDSSTETQKVVC